MMKDVRPAFPHFETSLPTPLFPGPPPMNSRTPSTRFGEVGRHFYFVMNFMIKALYNNWLITYLYPLLFIAIKYIISWRGRLFDDLLAMTAQIRTTRRRPPHQLSKSPRPVSSFA
jgi:hypothetical protein